MTLRYDRLMKRGIALEGDRHDLRGGSDAALT